MEALHLNPKEFPKLSQWGAEYLNEALERLVKTANPNKPEITEADKQWAATMLEMDLEAQHSQVCENESEEEDLMTAHNRMMLKKMKQENTPWAEDY
ncbi:hypothetical protein HHL23_13605 [Chryseobacterium sp. RP-3-3]|uniref:Uncharacterized protein n=1 Tax=Chryseobacterium antibioticum TaxID=2728847 RepID=A0A7Y0ANZ2_9FLAO|nr:hypothetical protein [Chryseobacterium antibioticum]NML70823.1 hypothetical protein [Chryseobacterium antibioticum]